jgi:pimeloyl-ACP methyl ester carboxylesterase
VAAGRYRKAFRYARAWLRTPHDLIEAERGEATLYRPAEARGPLPGWVVLHGITVPGRKHPVLVRFARALAATGAAVLVPDVPEWIGLRLAPDRTQPAVRAALDLLAAEAGVGPGPRGLVGFSFGAPQAIRVGAAMPDEIAGTVAFGGYCDLERTLRFQLTGHHEWQGVTRRLRPDPYGRWIVAGNYLTRVPEYETAGPTAEALLELARTAGEQRVPSWNAVYDPVKDRLAAALPPEQRALFRTLAPPSDREPLEPGDEVLVWAERLAAAARRQDPLVDALHYVERLPSPVHVLHGRADVLIPWTEGLRLAETLAPRGPVRASVTGLFAHSDEHALRGLVNSTREAVGFFRTLAAMLGVV